MEVQVGTPQLGEALAGESKDTCSFPVDKQNWLVAASGMVSMQLELGQL